MCILPPPVHSYARSEPYTQYAFVSLLFQGADDVMTSNAIRGIRRKKSSLSEVKVAVLGAPAVGKSGQYPDTSESGQVIKSQGKK